jgi:GLPGLI family protein
MTFSGLAQLKEGKVTYGMVFSSDKPDMELAIGMMEGSKMVLEFMPGKSRSDVSMGVMGTFVTIVDAKAKKALSLMDVMGTKYAVRSELEKSKMAPDEKDYKVEITSETKVIQGYTCTKAIMTADDGTIMTIWFTKDIVVHTGGLQYYKKEMPGFPLAMSMNEDEMVIEITASEILTKVNQNDLSMKIPEGYTEMTEEEFENLGK